MGLIDRAVSEYLYLTSALRMLRRVTPVARRTDRTIADAVEDWAAKWGERPALISEHETFSFADLNARANRYARWATANGIAKGDVVCLLMPNRPEYVSIWVGIARMGGVTALLNTNLTGKALGHSIDIVEPRHLIVAAPLIEAYRSARPTCGDRFTLWCHGDAGEGRRIDQDVARLSDAPIPRAERPALSLNDKCIYIYTSGTTGMPKAANVNHYRIQVMVNAFSAAMKASARDRIYVCLPLYHSSGGVVGIGACLSVGGSAVLVERFSVHRFWDDVVDHGCTIFQYVGELCRYLLNAPFHPKERQHRLRLIGGNGLRPDIWEAFRKRFGINHILEYYGATEGNVAIFNFDSRTGSVGRIAAWIKHRFPFDLVRFDVETALPLRGADGFAIRCGEDEAGELIAEILDDPLKPAQRFEGYADKASTEGKVLRDVFRPGDKWFRTGDLMRRDRHGYYYFVDRIGDTFRWKGENVSTSEVAEIINTCPGVRETVVYGVAIPGHEGRAGMAALVAGPGLDLEALRRHMHGQLPGYARPLFLRLRTALDTTSTHKQRKLDLIDEGFDPALISDPLYFDDLQQAALQPLDAALRQRIVSGAVRV